jgi:adhesin/invasin
LSQRELHQEQGKKPRVRQTRAGGVLFSACALLLALLASACNPLYGNSTAESAYSPGVTLSLSNSTLSIPVTQLAAGNSTVITLTLRDTNDVLYSSNLLSVTISSSGGTSAGTLSPAVPNADGTYSATFAGIQAGTTLTFSATVNGNLITSSPPSLQVVAGNASGISVSSGQSQTAQNGTALSPFVVYVKDTNGNALSGAQIDWVVSSGGGVLSTATSLTNSSGLAQSTLTLGDSVGVNSVTATLDGTSDSVLFTAVAAVGAVSGAESTISSSPAVVAADGMTASTLTVTLYDQNGNAVSGKSVSLSSNRGASDTISAASGLSNAYGQATFTVTSHTSGSATFSAVETTDSTNITPTASVSFTAGTPNIAITAGNNQDTDVGTAVSVAPKVHVQDSYGNALANTEVDWTVTTGGGSVANASVNTDASGNAQDPWTLGALSGANTLVATINGTSYSVTFSATADAGSPATIAVSSGSGQTGISGQTLSNPFTAVVKDANGNVVPDATVDWTIVSGGGSLSSSSGSTDVNGLASSTLTLGAVDGANVARATIHATSYSITFSATGISGSAGASSSSVSASQNSVTANGTSTSTITVTLLDSNGNPRLSREHHR